MTLKNRILEDMKLAMKSQDKKRLDTIRLINAGIKQQEIDSRSAENPSVILTDEQVVALLNKMVKQRQDSISQYQAGGRQDLVDQETFELQIIRTYLPELLSDDQIDKIILEAIKTSGATSAKDMGKVMAEVKAKIQGRADMTQVSAKVKEKLK